MSKKSLTQEKILFANQMTRIFKKWVYRITEKLDTTAHQPSLKNCEPWKQNERSQIDDHQHNLKKKGRKWLKWDNATVTKNIEYRWPMINITEK